MKVSSEAQRIKYSFLVLAHNEEESIIGLIADITVAAKMNQIETYEIYISEDGSTDSTRFIVQSAMRNDSRIRISEPSPRLGYSKSVLNAIRNSRGSILVFLDGDGQSSPFDVIKLIEYLKMNHQIVIGVRQKRQDFVSRKIYSKLFKSFYEILGFPKLKDPSSGSVIVFREFVLPITEHDSFLDLGFWWEFQAYMQKYLPARIEIDIPHFGRKFGLTKVYRRNGVLLIGIKHVLGLCKLRIHLNSKSNKVL